MPRELTHLFSDEGRLALSTILGTHPLLAFDFDGTLAPIVTHPDDARVSVSVAHSLDRLSRLRPVAIVSGRSVDDVTRRMGFSARFVVGNHGAEDPGQAPTFDTAPMNLVRQRLAAHAEEFRTLGVMVEDKGHSIALHYREAVDQRRAAERIETLLTGLPPTLRCYPGKCVVNVVATDAPDKYRSVAALVQRARCDSAIFVGDDVNDEPVFIGAPPNWLTVRVGRDDPKSQARFFLDQHAEVATLLDNMLGVLQRG